MNTQHKRKNSNTSRTLIGLIIILIGGLLLIDKLLPAIYLGWLFQWPMILIIIGAIIGAKSGFENRASYILIGIGLFFFLSNTLNFSIGPLIWPIILIAVGFFLIKGKSKKRQMRRGTYQYPENNDFVWDKRVKDESQPTDQVDDDTTDHDHITEEESSSSEQKDEYSDENHRNEEYSGTANDYIDSTSIFGGGKHYIVSQNFKGGDVVNIMGGSTINLMRADLRGPATLEVVQLFGGTTIIAPAHWIIKSEMASIFGDIEDKRFHTPAVPDHSKILYIKGTSLFGGITIKSI